MQREGEREISVKVLWAGVGKWRARVRRETEWEREEKKKN